MSARAPCAIASSTAGRTFSPGRLMATISGGSGNAARFGQHLRPIISDRVGLMRKISPVKPSSWLVCRKRLVKLTLLSRPLAPTRAMLRGVEIACQPARLRRGVQLLLRPGSDGLVVTAADFPGFGIPPERFRCLGESLIRCGKRFRDR